MTHRTLLLSLAILSMPVALQAQQLPYQNPSLSAHERAVDLCSRGFYKKSHKKIIFLDLQADS